MGIIIKQSIKGTAFTYLGVAIGFVTKGVLFPVLFKTHQIGLLEILLAYSTIFAQFASLGFNAATTRLFTYFRNEDKKHNGFLFVALVVSIIGFLLSLIVLVIIKPYLINTGNDDSHLFSMYFYYLVPLIFFTLFFNTLDNYYKVLYNSVIGTFLKEFAQRFLILIAFLLYYFIHVDFSVFVMFYVIAISLPTLFIIVSLIYQKQFSLKPKLEFINTELRKMLVGVSFFGIISGFSSLVILRLDTIMISIMLGLSSTGVYTTLFFYATLILIPSRALIKISSVVIADKWKDNNVAAISEIYYKSCINQLIIAALLFVGLWGNVDNIFRILPHEFLEGKYILLFIGLANLFDMATGVNGTIISTSKYYRIHTYIMLILIVLIILSNLIFIPIYGIVGAAMASALSVFIFNAIRYLFLYYKYKMQPFNYKHILIILISGLSYLSVYYIPEIDNLLLDIFIRGSIITITFVIPAYALKISMEINNSINFFLKKLGLIKHIN